MPVAIPLLPPMPPIPPVGEGGDIFIFRPAEPSPSGNVFASWLLLVTAAAAVVGPKIVYFDDTLAPCVIPAGAWDFGSCTSFIGCDGLPSGSGGPNTTPLTIDDGATLVHVFEFRSLDITSNTTTHVILTPIFGAHYYLSGTCKVTQADPAGTFIQSATGFVFSPVVVTLREYAQIATGAGPALNVTSFGASISVVAFDNSDVQADTIAAIVGAFAGGSVVDSASISNAQVGYLPGAGTLTQLGNLSVASKVAYVDAAPLLNAATVQEAIDALKDQPDYEMLLADTAQGVGFATLLSLAAFVVPGTSSTQVEIGFDASGETDAAAPTRVEFRLMVDGADALAGGVGSGTCFLATVGRPASTALTIVTPALAPGAHTIDIEWQSTIGGVTASISPVTKPNQEHATLRARLVRPQ